MEIENLAKILIIIHAVFGGIALFTGAVALIVKKGKGNHKKFGKAFYYTMLVAAFISLAISFFPKHVNPFLFSIGVFSIYLLLSGYRSLRYKSKELDLKADKTIAYLIILTGLFMIIYPIISSGKPNIILLVFGVLCLAMGSKDLRLFSKPEKLKGEWLKLHLGKMIGGYIAAVSAFFVVNQILPGIWNWFVPGIVGGGYITYWMTKLKKKESVRNI